MRLTTTALLTLAAFALTAKAFVIPLGRITSGPDPTKRALEARHDGHRGHGHGRYGKHRSSDEHNQQGPNDPQGKQGEDVQYEGNVVTVYTTVTGSPPQQTSVDHSEGQADCQGGQEGQEEQREASQLPTEQEKIESAKAEYQSPPLNDQTETPPESKETGGEEAGHLEQADSAQVKTANNGETKVPPAPSQEPENFKKPTEAPADHGDTEEGYQQDGTSDKSKDKEAPAGNNNNNPSGGSPHSEVPDDPVPQAKRAEGNPTGGNVLTPDEQQKILALHNSIREANGQPKLEWDGKLATFSAGWTRKCVAHDEHSGGKYGENMGGASGRPDPVGFVKMWTDEAVNYNCKKPRFGGDTGHYTALIWKDVKYVGCSLQECATMGNGDASMPWHWTCNYWPAPNDMSDEMARFKENIPCSKNKPEELA
ncbi:hypothetical protein NCC49_005166 [Naganishia albida]|nr:hypothetical protein NCC49_005166 [Naganishia albida]